MNIRDTFALPRDPANGIHGAKEGSWEYKRIAPNAPTPAGWQRVGERLIKRTVEERVYP